MDLPRARVTIARTSDADMRQRQVYVNIDAGPRATLMFGDSVTLEADPGAHVLKANNTLMTKKMAFTVEAGDDIEFLIINKPGRITLGFLTLLGVAPLFLSIERKVGPRLSGS
jgi:hypothetical protein